MFVRSQYKALIGETREYVKNLKENESPLRNKRKANEEEIFNLIDG